MKKYEIKIRGTTPVIYNRLKKELEDEKKKLKKNELNEWEEKNWIRKAEIRDGMLILPREWFKSMLINAAKKTRLVPHFATSKKETFTQYIGSCMVEDAIFYDGKKPLTKDDLKPFGAYMGAQGANSKTKVWRVRPTFTPPWTATITFIDPFERITIDELKELVEFGGAFIGIGDSRNMNYGRFEVVSIKEAKE